jgi:glycosidase
MVERIGYLSGVPKSFYDSNNDGVGDIPGIIAKLPYLKTLGITLIWVSPFYRSPGADNGYDIADYYAVNPDLGQMQDVDNLIKQAGELGIEVMVDLVVNHTSDEHPWFQAALADPQSKYRDYYIFKPAAAGGAPITGDRFLAAARGKKSLARSATICTFFIKSSRISTGKPAAARGNLRHD